MRNWILAVLIAAEPCILFAQLDEQSNKIENRTIRSDVSINPEKPILYIGMNGSISSLSFGSTKYSNGEISNTSYNFSLEPNLGYIFNNKLITGIGFSIGGFKFIDTDNEEIHNSEFTIGPFVKYYLLPGKISPFFKVDYKYGSGKYNYNAGDSVRWENKNIYYEFSGGGGISYTIRTNVLIELELYYSYYKDLSKNNREDYYRYRSNSFGYRFGFVFLI